MQQQLSQQLSQQPGAPDEDALAALKREDIEWVSQMARGDRDSLARLYDRYGSSLLGLALRILHQREEAEEVLQEVLVQAWRQAERYDSRKASVRTWLSLMTRSRAIDRRRVNMTRSRTKENVQRSGTLRTRVEPEGAQNVWLGQLRDRLKHELAKIPPAQRQIVELIYFGGLTQLQVSQRTGVPLGTVKTRCLLAMKKLRLALGQDLHSPA